MALRVVVKLLDRGEIVLIETGARHWDAAALRRALSGASWHDMSTDPGYSDFVTDLDAVSARRLYEELLVGYDKWIALYEDIITSHTNKGEFKAADSYAKVCDEDKSQLTALTQIVERAEAEGLKVRILLEEWSSGT